MKKHVFFLFLACLSFNSFAQDQVQDIQRKSLLNTQRNKAFDGQKMVGLTAYDLEYEKNPLTFETWPMGTVFFSDGKSADSVYINYDVELNVLVFKLDQDLQPFSLSTDQVERFNLDAEKQMFIKINKSEFKELDNPMAFFQVLYQNTGEKPIFLVKQPSKKIFPADAQLTYTSKPEDIYKSEVTYFIKQGNQKYEEFSMNKKGIKNLVSKAEFEKIQDYAKENNLKWSEDADIVKIFQNFF